MSDTVNATSWKRHSPLTGFYHEGLLGPVQNGVPSVTLRQCLDRHITQIDIFESGEQAVLGALADFGLGDGLPDPVRGVVTDTAHLLSIGPSRYWLVTCGDDDPAPGLSESVAGAAAITAQGHGRLAVRLAGAKARDVLAKGSSLDFHPTQFTAGDSVGTGLLQFAVQLHCLDEEPIVDIYVARSMAVSFWEWLVSSAGEYGASVDSPITSL